MQVSREGFIVQVDTPVGHEHPRYYVAKNGWVTDITQAHVYKREQDAKGVANKTEGTAVKTVLPVTITLTVK